jgi:hypothetical protein
MKDLPERFRVEDDGQRLVISWRWLKWSHPLLFMGLMMQLGWPLEWYGEELINEPLALLDKPGFQIAFTLGHLGLMLLIRHGPIPWPGNHTLTRQELAQLYGEKIRHTRKKKVTYTYSLMATTRSGGTVKLLEGLEDLEQVRYLEHTLEQRLGIKDRRVGGENGTGVVFDW